MRYVVGLHDDFTQTHFGERTETPDGEATVNDLNSVLTYISEGMADAQKMGSKEAWFCLQTLNLKVTSLRSRRLLVSHELDFKVVSYPEDALINMIKTVRAATAAGLRDTKNWCQKKEPRFSDFRHLGVILNVQQCRLLAHKLTELGVVVVSC